MTTEVASARFGWCRWRSEVVPQDSQPLSSGNARCARFRDAAGVSAIYSSSSVVHPNGKP